MSRFRVTTAGLAAVFSCLLLTAPAWADQQQTERSLSEADALTSFDQVWERVRDQYFDFERIAADWEQGREELRPRAAQAQSAAALRPVLHELLALIGESHFTILGAETFERLAELEGDEREDLPDIAPEAPRAATGLAVRLVDDAVRVTELRPGSPAAESGIELGWSLLQVDELELGPALTQLASIEEADERSRAVTLFEYGLQYRLSFPMPEQAVELALIDSEGERHQHRLTGAALEHGAVQIGNLPPMTFEFALERREIPAGCVSVISFSTWVPTLAEEFQERRDEIFECPAMVLDLRGNPGGVLASMITLASDLFTEPALFGTLLRSDARLEFRAMPRRVAMDGTRLSPFSGPIAILIDGMSGSTSELFAAGMQATERAALFGQRTAGMALPSRTLPLASGDFLMYAFADYQDALGRRIEGVGVYPDYPVKLNAENISMPTAPVLQAALNWISKQFDS